MFIWILLIIIVAFLALEFYAHHRLFRPHTMQGHPKRRMITIRGDQGNIYADYLKHPINDSKGLILCSHGNQSNIVRCQPWAEQLHALGYDVLVYDYPGYGLSHGKPSEKNLFKCILTVYDYTVKTLGYRTNDIIALGRSLGGGPSSYLATQRPLKALILDSTFLSAYRVSLPFSLPGDKFKNKQYLAQLSNQPILIIHGKRDQLIHWKHAKTLSKVARLNNPTTISYIAQADHQTIIYFPEYWESLQSFLDTLSTSKMTGYHVLGW